MKVLVTGAAGFVGAAATRALMDAGHEVVAPLRESTNAARLQGLAIATPRLALEDEAAVSALLAAEAPRAILHAAWYAGPTDYLDAAENEACAAVTLALGQAAVRAGVERFVGVGSCAEYAAQDQPHREEDACAPTSLYGRSKVLAHEGLTALFADAGVGFAWARLFHLHGPGEAPLRLLPWVAARLRAGQEVALTPGAQVRDHLHIDDAGRALAMLVDHDLRGAVNVASGIPVTLRAVLEVLGALLERPELLRFGARPYRAGEPMHLCADVSRLRALGFRPHWEDLRRGLAHALGVL